ncbi:MAG: hypothetical protein ACSHYF_13840 [Verrucomicrobiaceae bacterium]
MNSYLYPKILLVSASSLSAQELFNYTNDFTSIGSVGSDFTQTATGEGGLNPGQVYVGQTKHGHGNANSVSMNSTTASGTSGVAVLTAVDVTGAELVTDDVEGSLSFDFRSDDDGAVTAGDQYGVGFFSNTGNSAADSFRVYVEATGISDYSVFADSGATKTSLASFNNLGYAGDWITVNLDYAMKSDGTVEFSSVVNGIFDDSGATMTGVSFPQSTTGQVMTLAGGLGSAPSVRVGMFGNVSANPNTAHGSLDNVGFSAESVPEPQSALLALIGCLGLLRRTRKGV